MQLKNSLGALVFSSMALFHGLSGFSACATEPCAYSVGVVPQFDERRIHSVWAPLLEKLGEITGCELKLVGSKSIDSFEQEIREGKFEFAYVNPVQVWMGFTVQGYLPLMRSSSKKLQGIIVVKRDDQIQGLKELEGEKVAFPSPIALGATLLPQDDLSQRGIHFLPQYVKTHSSVYFHVAKGLVRAGAGVARTFNEQPAFIKDRLRIIHTTNGVFPHAFVAHGRVPKQVTESIQQAWLALWREQPDIFSGIPMKNPEKPLVEDYESMEKWIIK